MTGFSFLESGLQEELQRVSEEIDVPAFAELIHEGQHVTMLPLVVDGIIRVSTRFEDKEFLLYYIRAQESCTMSFSCIINDTPSKIFAVAEEPSRLRLVPYSYVKGWIHQYPNFNFLFHRQFQHRYEDLLETIRQLTFLNLEERLMHYLTERSGLHKNPSIKLTHRQIADDLGTSREVVSRVLKKLERQGRLAQSTLGIQIL